METVVHEEMQERNMELNRWQPKSNGVLNPAGFRIPVNPESALTTFNSSSAWSWRATSMVDGGRGDRDRAGAGSNPKTLVGEAASPMLLSTNTTLTSCCFQPHQFLPLAQVILPSPCQTSTDVLTPTGAQTITNRTERLVRAVFFLLPELSAILKRDASHFLTLLSETFLWAALLVFILLGEHREAPTKMRLTPCSLT